MNTKNALQSIALGLAGLGVQACTITTVTTSRDSGTASDNGSSGVQPAMVEASAPAQNGGDAGAGNGCSDPPSNNQTPTTATMITLGTPVHACLRSGMDVNYFQYTVPTTPVKGGYVIVKVSDVGLMGTIELQTQPTSDSAQLVDDYDSTRGGGAANFFAAKPGASFRAVVKNFVSPPASAPETPFTLTVTFTGVNDPSAPNTTVATAAPLVPGTPIQGYFFVGYDSTTDPPGSAWESWYKVTLPAGMASVALTNVAVDAAGEVAFFDSTTTSIADHYNSTRGTNVQFDVPTATAGDYYLRVDPFTKSSASGGSTNIPMWMTQPWSLTVTPK
jgi:hypothetical protein